MELGREANLAVEQALVPQPPCQIVPGPGEGLPALQQLYRELEAGEIVLQASAVLGDAQPGLDLTLRQGKALLPGQRRGQPRGQGTIQMQVQVDHAKALPESYVTLQIGYKTDYTTKIPIWEEPARKNAESH